MNIQETIVTINNIIDNGVKKELERSVILFDIQQYLYANTQLTDIQNYNYYYYKPVTNENITQRIKRLQFDHAIKCFESGQFVINNKTAPSKMWQDLEKSMKYIVKIGFKNTFVD